MIVIWDKTFLVKNIVSKYNEFHRDCRFIFLGRAITLLPNIHISVNTYGTKSTINDKTKVSFVNKSRHFNIRFLCFQFTFDMTRIIDSTIKDSKLRGYEISRDFGYRFRFDTAKLFMCEFQNFGPKGTKLYPCIRLLGCHWEMEPKYKCNLKNIGN